MGLDDSHYLPRAIKYHVSLRLMREIACIHAVGISTTNNMWSANLHSVYVAIDLPIQERLTSRWSLLGSSIIFKSLKSSIYYIQVTAVHPSCSHTTFTQTIQFTYIILDWQSNPWESLISVCLESCAYPTSLTVIWCSCRALLSLTFLTFTHPTLLATFFEFQQRNLNAIPTLRKFRSYHARIVGCDFRATTLTSPSYD